MSKKFKMLAGVLSAAVVLAVGFTSVAFADAPEATEVGKVASYGEPGLGTGPGEMHQWGPQDGNGACYGEPGPRHRPR